MRKGKNIIGMTVLSQAEAQNLGKVRDLIFDHASGHLVALLLSDRDLFGLIDAQVIPWTEVRSIGPDAVMAATASSRMKAGDCPPVKEVMNRDTALSGTRIVTSEGKAIGTLADMFVDETTGQILGYEISSGFFADTMSGKRFLPASSEMPVGDGVAVVPSSVTEDFENQRTTGPGGVAGVVNVVGEKLTNAYEGAVHSVSGALDTTRDKLSHTYENIAHASIARQKEFVIGKKAGNDVFLPGSSGETSDVHSSPPSDFIPGEPVETASVHDISQILVARGEIITEAHANRAEQAGILGQLVVAAGGGAANEAISSGRERISEVAHTGQQKWEGATASGSQSVDSLSSKVQEKAEAAALGKQAGRDVLASDGSILVAQGQTISQEILDRARAQSCEKEVIAAAGLGAAQQGVETIKTGASQLWDSIRQKANDLGSTAQEKKNEYDAQAEQNRINDALGRTTTRVILDRDDNVILNSGETITNAAIDRARQAGVLDLLLNSVYGYPTEVAHAPQAGEEIRVEASEVKIVPEQNAVDGVREWNGESVRNGVTSASDATPALISTDTDDHPAIPLPEGHLENRRQEDR